MVDGGIGSFCNELWYSAHLLEHELVKAFEEKGKKVQKTSLLLCMVEPLRVSASGKTIAVNGICLAF